MTHQPSPTETAALLDHWLNAALSPEQLQWLQGRFPAISQGDRKSLYLAFGLAARKTSKADLQLSPAELGRASALRPGWNPSLWSIEQTVRTRLLLAYPSDPADTYLATLDQLFSTAEVHELVALYQALPLLPHAGRLTARGAEGLRTNIKSVFTAVAHHNPFPSERFSDDQWNQMVLKCLFIGVSLVPVQGLIERRNPALAEMLCEFAQERRAAGRPVPAELWRCVGPYATGSILSDLQRALSSSDPAEQASAAAALREAPAE